MQHEQTDNRKKREWRRRLAGALASILLLPVPGYAALPFIVFNSWSPLSSPNGTLVTVGSSGPGSSNNLLSFFPPKSSAFSDDFTLSSTISNYNPGPNKNLVVKLNSSDASNLTAGTLTITVSVAGTAVSPNIVLDASNPGNNQFTSTASAALPVDGSAIGETVSVRFQLSNSTTSSTASTPYQLTVSSN